MYQTMLLILLRVMTNINQFGEHAYKYLPLVDQSINYGSTCHLAFAIPALIVFIVFNILPPLVPTCYPFKRFRSYLSKFHLNFIAMHIFIDRVHSCYRNGLDGGRDMRSFSGLYFFLRFILWMPSQLSNLLASYFKVHTNLWFISGILFSVISLSMAFIKPYNKVHMNYFDALLLLNMTILNFALSTGWYMLLTTRILLSMPIVLLCLVICTKKMYSIIKCTVKASSSRLKFLCTYFRDSVSTVELTEPEIANIDREAQPLIQPTSIVIGYGAN